MIYIILTIASLLIIAIAAINYRFRQHMYEMWVEDFESALGLNVPDDDKRYILPFIFAEDHATIESAVKRYYQVKFNKV